VNSWKGMASYTAICRQHVSEEKPKFKPGGPYRVVQGGDGKKRYPDGENSV
jgi:hypothetical protein